MRWGLVLVAISLAACGAADVAPATATSHAPAGRPRTTTLPSSTPEASGDRMTITQPATTPVFTPLPLVARVRAEGAWRVLVSFKADGDTRWLTATLVPEDEASHAFVGEVDCGALRGPGKLRYFATAVDAHFEPIASVGSEAIPLETSVEIDAPPIAAEGHAPPRACTPEEANAHWKGTFIVIVPD